MFPERLKKIEEIYHEVLEISPNERHLFLQKSCGEDAELRREVESLLSFEKTFDSLIDSSPKSLVVEMFAEKADIIGSEINQYKILSLLGEGGMGAVYLAQDTSLERKVAIKLLSSEFAFDSIRRNRFFQEAKSASALNHPNILTVHEIGELNGIHYIVTEFIAGKTLNNYLFGKQSTFQNILEIATQIASALSAAHEAGIIHRDIKPDNVMVRNDEIVKILDFGIAKLTDSIKLKDFDTESQTRVKTMTLPGTIIGTPQYMSPEQARGQKVDSRTDIFSFGVVLYEMLTGFLPFNGATNMDIIGSVLKDDPKPLSDHQPEISGNLEIIVKKALSKDRDLRYQSIKDVLNDLNIAKQTLESDSKLVNQTVSIKGKTTIKTTGIVTEKRFSLIHALIFSLIATGLIGVIWWLLPFKSGETLADLPLKTTEVVSWTSKAGEVYSVGTFSPDAKMVAFASTQTGSKNIWIKQTTSGEAVQITKDEFKNENPIWSPNGDELAFFSTKNGEAGFWRIPTLGGSPKLISYIDDGSSRLRFWSKSNHIYYESKKEIFAIDANSGQKKQVTDLAAKGIKATFINLSFDEKNVTYTTIEGETTIVWLNNLNNETPKKLLESKSEIKNITWHPDNQHIFYSASVDRIFQVFVTDISGTLPRQISTTDQDSLVLDVSADGTKILYGSAKEESDVWGINLINAKEFIVASDMNSELWADVSPDEKTLAYQSIKNLRQGNNLFNGNILIKTIGEQSQPQELVKNGGLPKWSPDGKTLAFIRIEADKYQIKTIKTLGSDEKSLTTKGVSTVSFSLLPYNRVQTSEFSWSPDSSKVAYLSLENDSPSDVWITNADGSNEINLTENKDNNLSLFCPLWSADGKKIAFTTKTNNSEGKPTYTLKIIDTETKKIDTILQQSSFMRLVGWTQTGKELLLVTVKDKIVGLPPEVSLIKTEIVTSKMSEVVKLKDAYLFNIHLSPDKKTVAFAAHREEKDNIWLISVNGGEAKKITNNNDSRLYFSSLAWSSDSNSIFFGKQLRYSLLSMFTNFK